MKSQKTRLEKLPSLAPKSASLPVDLPADKLNNSLALLARQGWIIKLEYMVGGGWWCKIVWPHSDKDGVEFSNATFVQVKGYRDATTAFRAALEQQKPKVDAYLKAHPDFESAMRMRRGQGRTALLRVLPPLLVKELS